MAPSVPTGSRTARLVSDLVLTAALSAQPLSCNGPVRHFKFLTVRCQTTPASNRPTGSRTARLVSDLVLTGQLLSASVLVGYPGERYPGMALVYGVPRDGGSCATMCTTVVKCTRPAGGALLQLPVRNTCCRTCTNSTRL